MKRIARRSHAPADFRTWVRGNPSAEWDGGGNRRKRGKAAAQLALFEDQRGLCCYCEGPLRHPSNPARPADDDAVRVEHVHPKSVSACQHRPGLPQPNWHVLWSNLLAVCPGGSQQAGPSRVFQTCDRPKAELDLCGAIVTPTALPAHEPTYRVRLTDGVLEVATTAEPGLAPRLRATIAALNLNSSAGSHHPRTRLPRQRLRAVADALSVVDMLTAAGHTRAQARTEVARRLFCTNASTAAAPEFLPTWPSYFTAIRSALSPEADELLRRGGYTG